MEYSGKLSLHLICKCGGEFKSYRTGTNTLPAREQWQKDHRDCMKPRQLLTNKE